MSWVVEPGGKWVPEVCGGGIHRLGQLGWRWRGRGSSQDTRPVSGACEGMFPGRARNRPQNVRVAWEQLLAGGRWGQKSELGSPLCLLPLPPPSPARGLGVSLPCTCESHVTLRPGRHGPGVGPQLLVWGVGEPQLPHSRLCSAGRGVRQEGDRRERPGADWALPAARATQEKERVLGREIQGRESV